MSKKHRATAFAILAAAMYAINIPAAKVLLNSISPTMMAAFLYLGAGLGLLSYSFLRRAVGKNRAEEPLTIAELPYTIAMVILDIAAPIFLMLGISLSSSANVSLLNNFEIVATSVIAFIIFKERLSKGLWLVIVLVTIAGIILSFNGTHSFAFNRGSIFVLLACICWGFENNCTRMLSSKSAMEIVVIKGCFSGLGSLCIACVLKEKFPAPGYLVAVLILGFVSYGLSIVFYILAQKDLGAAKTSAYYSVAPFIGVIFSMLALGERPGLQFYFALMIMIIGTIILAKDTISLQHTHDHRHAAMHEHNQADKVYRHRHLYVHSHVHVHGEEENNHTHKHTFAADHDHNVS